MIEICSSDVTNYMVPLSRQTDFFVPEMKEDVKTDVKEEDSDEDRGTDITGKHFCSFRPNTVLTVEPSLGNNRQLTNNFGFPLAVSLTQRHNSRCLTKCQLVSLTTKLFFKKSLKSRFITLWLFFFLCHSIAV